jgi:gamma-glutamyl phosphate reductase
MKKEELLAKLEVAKEVTSVVSIDLIISALNELELPTKTGITQELADEIANRIELCLDRNADDLVYKDNITFSIQFGNQLEIDEAQIDVSETMEHITACLEEFVVEEDEDDEEETGHTLPGFENGVGLDNLNIRFQDKQGI